MFLRVKDRQFKFQINVQDGVFTNRDDDHSYVTSARGGGRVGRNIQGVTIVVSWLTGGGALKGQIIGDVLYEFDIIPNRPLFERTVGVSRRI